MKKILLAFVLMAGVQMTYAQDGGVHRQKIAPDERLEKRADRLEKDLLLTSDQKAAIVEIDKRTMEEIKSKRTKNRDEIHGIRNRNEVEYKKVLTEEQYKKYEELKEERKERMSRRKK